MKEHTTDALEILFKRYYEGHPNRIAGLEDARESAAIAREIYRVRHELGISQRELARRVGTSPSVISRIENDDYDGHSLSLLRRVARGLDCQLHVAIVPVAKEETSLPKRKSA